MRDSGNIRKLERMREPLFITEKQTEDLLALETRDIVMPDGSRRPFTGFRLMWNSFDQIVDDGLFAGPELAGLAVLATNETSQPFDRTFPNTVGYVAGQLRQLNGKLIEEFRRLLR